MIRENDKMKISIALQDYDKQKANYHFYNWELAELERCEKEIQSVISSYADNIPGLIELGQEFPRIQKYIPNDLMQKIQNYANSQQGMSNVYYSLDGQTFSTIEEAIARNEALQSIVEKPKTK